MKLSYAEALETLIDVANEWLIYNEDEQDSLAMNYNQTIEIAILKAKELQSQLK